MFFSWIKLRVSVADMIWKRHFPAPAGDNTNLPQIRLLNTGAVDFPGILIYRMALTRNLKNSNTRLNPIDSC